jgi:hypothetical protein
MDHESSPVSLFYCSYSNSEWCNDQDVQDGRY